MLLSAADHKELATGEQSSAIKYSAFDLTVVMVKAKLNDDDFGSFKDSFVDGIDRCRKS
jgi:hypothetical protein